MKFKKGDRVIVLDTIHTPSVLVGMRVKVIGVCESDKTYWCETKVDKCRLRYWISEYSLELVKTYKHKERIMRKIEKLQAKRMG